MVWMETQSIAQEVEPNPQPRYEKDKDIQKCIRLMCAVPRQMKDLALSRSSIYQTITENIPPPPPPRQHAEMFNRQSARNVHHLKNVPINSKLAHLHPPPPPHPCAERRKFHKPQRTCDGAFDHNTRGVRNLIRIAQPSSTCLPDLVPRLFGSWVVERWIRYINPPRCWGCYDSNGWFQPGNISMTSRLEAPFTHDMQFSVRFFMLFRVQNVPYPTHTDAFFAKYQLDWEENYNILVGDTPLSKLCELGGVLAQSYTTKDPCGVGRERFCSQNCIAKLHKKPHV